MCSTSQTINQKKKFLSSFNEDNYSILPSLPPLPSPSTIVLRHSMEDRGLASTSIQAGDDHPPNPKHQYNHDHNHAANNARPGTYVVQVPKNGTYRTSPTENALLVECQSNAPIVEKPSTRPIKYILISMIILKVIMVIIFWIMLAMTKKDDPQFHIKHVQVMTKDKIREGKHEFDITLALENPNAHAIILFDSHGNTSLSFKDKKFANGAFPSSTQDPKNSKDVRLTLTSFSSTKLPIELRASMYETDKMSQNHVKMALKIQVPMKMKVGIMEMKSKTLSMLCHFEVDNLAKNSRILSQDCEYTRV